MKSYQELSKNNKLFSAKSYPPINSLAIVNLSLRVSKAKQSIHCLYDVCTPINPIILKQTILEIKKFNDDYPIMQDLVSSGVLSDKGFPLICTPKENTFKGK